MKFVDVRPIQLDGIAWHPDGLRRHASTGPRHELAWRKRARVALDEYAKHPWFKGHVMSNGIIQPITAWLTLGFMYPWHPGTHRIGPPLRPVILKPERLKHQGVTYWSYRIEEAQ